MTLLQWPIRDSAVVLVATNANCSYPLTLKPGFFWPLLLQDSHGTQVISSASATHGIQTESNSLFKNDHNLPNWLFQEQLMGAPATMLNWMSMSKSENKRTVNYQWFFKHNIAGWYYSSTDKYCNEFFPEPRIHCTKWYLNFSDELG